MQTTQAFLRKPGFIAVAAALALALGGCATKISNMTAESVNENPSQLYTITALVKPRAAGLEKNSVSPKIVIDGQIHEMKPSAAGKDIFEYEYSLPPGRNEAAYYILVNYTTITAGVSSQHEDYTEKRTLKVLNRRVYTLDVTRAPIGARVAIVGRGFTPQDVVYLDATPARTIFESANSISFMVPAVAASRDYGVVLNNGGGIQAVGTFHVDGLALTVSPQSLTLRAGEKASLSFSLGTPAPAGGLLVDVTTDVPHSVIMPEVIIPAGSTSTVVTIQAGQPGSGNLFVSGAGSGEVSVPISVGAR